ncbi:MAG TPA: chemotaxis protein CheW [Smithellaceae bacterium]|nr:chemotaxis protein CheW [Smithellaceae bacterium]HRS82537.1 chemotaxis protein CheW [Smithellaceae bacterium]HRV44036.1 chemotaxis protein CheW [Smithellaceae bacterium]
MANAEKYCWKVKGIFGDGSCAELPRLIHCRRCPVFATAGRQHLDRDLPPAYLGERAAVMALPKETGRLGTLSVMVFRLCGEKFAVKTIYFQEAAEPSPVHTLPLKVNRIFRGIANINGELLLCLSVADLLDLTSEAQDNEPPAAYERMLVVGREGQRFVFPVEQILGVHRIAPEDLGEVPATLSRSAKALTRGIFLLDKSPVGLLDEERLFPAMTRSLNP